MKWRHFYVDAAKQSVCIAPDHCNTGWLTSIKAIIDRNRCLNKLIKHVVMAIPLLISSP